MPTPPYMSRNGITEKGATTNKKYALRDYEMATTGVEAAKLYVSDENLWKNYKRIIDTILKSLKTRGRNINTIFGEDAIKVKSSLELFLIAITNLYEEGCRLEHVNIAYSKYIHILQYIYDSIT